MIHQRILKLLFPELERERMHYRECISRATAEAEDLVRTLETHGNEIVKKFKNGNGSG